MLKEKSNIRTCIADNGDLESDRRYFTPVFKLEPYIFIQSVIQVEEVSRQAGMEVTSFDDWLELTQSMLERAIKRGITVFKSTLAYERSIFMKR